MIEKIDYDQALQRIDILINRGKNAPFHIFQEKEIEYLYSIRAFI